MVATSGGMTGQFHGTEEAYLKHASYLLERVPARQSPCATPRYCNRPSSSTTYQSLLHDRGCLRRSTPDECRAH